MDLERIEKLIQQFGASRARELVVEADDWRVAMKREPSPAQLTTGDAPMPAPPAPPVEESPAEPDTVPIAAPLVGIYRQGIARLAVGSTIQAGEQAGSIEAMRIQNPVIAEVTGEIAEVLVEDGQPVEYGQRLYAVRPHLSPGPEGAP